MHIVYSRIIDRSGRSQSVKVKNPVAYVRAMACCRLLQRSLPSQGETSMFTYLWADDNIDDDTFVPFGRFNDETIYSQKWFDGGMRYLLGDQTPLFDALMQSDLSSWCDGLVELGKHLLVVDTETGETHDGAGSDIHIAMMYADQTASIKGAADMGRINTANVTELLYRAAADAIANYKLETDHKKIERRLRRESPFV